MRNPERFKIPVLVTLNDDSEEIRSFTVEATSLSEAIRIAKEQAQEDERVVEAEAQITNPAKGRRG